MNHTFVFSVEKAKDVLPSYNWRNRQEAFTFLDAVNGDKNIYSTPRDLLKWDYALTYGNLFKQSTLDSAYAGYSFEKPGHQITVSAGGCIISRQWKKSFTTMVGGMAITPCLFV